MGWFSRFRPEPGITMVFHTEAMTAIDEERPVAPYVCGPLGSTLIRLWMPDTDLHQDSLAQVLDFMITRGRLTLPGVLLREPDAARPNQVAIAAGGIRLGRLPDEVAADVAGAVVELKSKGWLAVGAVSFVVSQPGGGEEARPVEPRPTPVGVDSNVTGGSTGGTTGRIGCRLVIPDYVHLAQTMTPR